MMVEHQDPTQPEEFGGEPSELRKIHKYSKALYDLKAKHRSNQKDHDKDKDKDEK